MTAFASPNNRMPIYDNWLLISKDGGRYVELQDADSGWHVSSTDHVQCIEIAGPLDKKERAAQAIVEREVNGICTSPALSKDTASEDLWCQTHEETVKLLTRGPNRWLRLSSTTTRATMILAAI